MGLRHESVPVPGSGNFGSCPAIGPGARLGELWKLPCDDALLSFLEPRAEEVRSFQEMLRLVARAARLAQHDRGWNFGAKPGPLALFPDEPMPASVEPALSERRTRAASRRVSVSVSDRTSQWAARDSGTDPSGTGWRVRESLCDTAPWRRPRALETASPGGSPRWSGRSPEAPGCDRGRTRQGDPQRG